MFCASVMFKDAEQSSVKITNARTVTLVIELLPVAEEPLLQILRVSTDLVDSIISK